MVNKAKINGVEFGFGLVWEDLNSQKTKAQIQSILDVNSCKFGVHKKDKDNPDEQQLGYTNLKELKGTLSAAYVLASISKEITVIERISEEDFWICGVNEGKIISTTDVVVAQHDLADHIENLKGTYSDIEIPFEITCSEEVAEIISEMGVEVSIE
ncbi:type 4b pilus protein PilO2, partial [Vibrio parahaemolyticus]|nr:type 4b pilus protein PilO2 [Vibrio parahaemolyticus]